MDALMKIQTQNIKNRKSLANKNVGDLDMNYAHQDDLMSSRNTGKKARKPEEMLARNRLLWSDEYLVYIEENFDSIFRDLYEEKFVDKIFLTHESRITKEDFIGAVAGTIDEPPKCEWLFTPSKIRELFQESINFDDLESDAQS